MPDLKVSHLLAYIQIKKGLFEGKHKLEGTQMEVHTLV